MVRYQMSTLLSFGLYIGGHCLHPVCRGLKYDSSLKVFRALYYSDEKFCSGLYNLSLDSHEPIRRSTGFHYADFPRLSDVKMIQIIRVSPLYRSFTDICFAGDSRVSFMQMIHGSLFCILLRGLYFAGDVRVFL